jgi:hypothetical protein
MYGNCFNKGCPNSMDWAGGAAMMYVVGQATHGDVEVWLDYNFSTPHRNGDRRMLLARAEAARWRDDDVAQAKWEGRALRLMKLIKDHPTDCLAKLVEF